MCVWGAVEGRSVYLALMFLIEYVVPGGTRIQSSDG